MATRVYFFPKYSSKGPSSRYRIYNFIYHYDKAGYVPIVYPLFEDWYLECIWNHNPKWKIIHRIIWAYLKRLVNIIRLPVNSKLYIGSELFPYIPYGLEFILAIKRIKYIIEYDDAVFHYYDLHRLWIVRRILEKKTPTVISRARHVITGSEYLTNYAKKYNPSVTEIPTCIDEKKYENQVLANKEIFVIGWIGSPSQSKQLIKIVPAFKRLALCCDYKLNLIGYDKKLRNKLDGLPTEFIEWSDDTEVYEMAKFTVGIMPLDDSSFSKGKCAFKLVQYMALGIPTISTPLQSNININSDSSNLFANTVDEWYDAFVRVIQNPEYFEKVGLKNKSIAMENYTIQANVNKHLELIELLK